MILDTVVKGDYERINFTIYNPDGTIRNITGETVHFYAKRANTDTTPLIHKDSASTGGVTISNPTGGGGSGATHGYVALLAGDLSAVTADTTLPCSIKHVDASGNPSSTEFQLPVRVSAGS